MKKIIGTVALAAGVFGLAACSVPEEPEMNAPETEAPAPEAPAPEAPAPEAPAPEAPAVVTNPSDGVFTYQVTELGDRDVFYDSWGDPYYPDQDRFYVVDVTATNDSTAPATAPDPWMLDHVMAIDTEGRAHMADDEPWTDTADLNPGATTSYEVAWDLPAGVEIEYVELSAPEAYDVAVLEVD